VAAPRRTARFRCVIALAAPERTTGPAARTGIVGTVEGVCEGAIAEAPRGTHGFGYDPIFLLPERDRTIAELPPEEKNAISHRGRAGRAARRLVAAWLTGDSGAAPAAAASALVTPAGAAQDRARGSAVLGDAAGSPSAAG
jgi:XTP/dITP diphosphohydrolase